MTYCTTRIANNQSKYHIIFVLENGQRSPLAHKETMNARRLLPFLFGLILASVVTGVDNVSSSQLRQDKHRHREGAPPRHLREPLGEHRRLPEESIFSLANDWSPEEIGALSGLFFLLLIIFILYCCCGCSLCDILMLFCCWELCCDQGMVDTI